MCFLSLNLTKHHLCFVPKINQSNRDLVRQYQTPKVMFCVSEDLHCPKMPKGYLAHLDKMGSMKNGWSLRTWDKKGVPLLRLPGKVYFTELERMNCRFRSNVDSGSKILYCFIYFTLKHFKRFRRLLL